MKKRLNKKTICLTAAALTMTMGLSVGTALAYFTTYAEASGGVALDLGFTTTVPGETVDDWTKHVTISNTGDYDCYVRVRAFAGNAYTLQYSGGNWTLGTDGYYYYNEIVPAGGSTGTLDIVIAGAVDGQSFNVVVVQECTPVQYDEDGSPYADWNVIADSSEESYGQEVGE